MAERRSFPLAAVSLAALGLMAPAKAADMATTPLRRNPTSRRRPSRFRSRPPRLRRATTA